MLRNLEDLEFVILDVETTGLDPLDGDRIVEIAALRGRGDEVLDEFQTLINPQRPISEAASNVNHITDEMVKEAPTIDKVMQKFLDFIQGAYVVGYNVGFDLNFIEAEMNRLNLELPKDLITLDVLRMTRKLLPDLGSFSLENVSRQLRLVWHQTHRALCDVRLTHRLFLHLAALIKEKGISSLKDVHSLFGLQSELADRMNNQKLAQIQEAIDLGVQLKIKYFSGTGEVTERNVSPKEIRREGKNTYLVGHCHLRKEERTFRLNAILHLEIV